MLMSDLTHRSLACKAHLNILIENALYKFISITITYTDLPSPIVYIITILCLNKTMQIIQYFITFSSAHYVVLLNVMQELSVLAKCVYLGKLFALIMYSPFL